MTSPNPGSVRQLAPVLGYLHRQGWLHLDVTPENVVVQEGRVVLIAEVAEQLDRVVAAAPVRTSWWSSRLPRWR